MKPGCQQEPCCASFVAGQWVAETDVNQPLIAKVKEVHPPLFEGDEPSMDLVIYSYKGEKLGRVSDAFDGPKKYEPCCPCKNYTRIDPPSFPVQRDLMGDPTSLVWHNA